MKERPILFSGPMVKAILDGRKTQTRRVVRDLLESPCGGKVTKKELWAFPDRFYSGHVLCPYGQPGDRLWVRETWAPDDQAPSGIVYRNPPNWGPVEHPPVDKWKPSIHMPRWASRITLEITGVRVEPLQEISEDDAKAEGIGPFEFPFCKNGHCREFGKLWNRIAKPGAQWADNPWVWVIEFRRLP